MGHGDTLEHGQQTDTDHVEWFDPEVVCGCCIEEKREGGVEITFFSPVADEKGHLGQRVYHNRDVAFGFVFRESSVKKIDDHFKEIGVLIHELFERLLAPLGKEPSPVGSTVQLFEQSPRPFRVLPGAVEDVVEEGINEPGSCVTVGSHIARRIDMKPLAEAIQGELVAVPRNSKPSGSLVKVQRLDL